MEKGYTIHVLDHGYVRYVDSMGDDQRILEFARVCYGSASKGEELDKKLLKYLYSHQHTSPFESVKITFNIKMPIFVMRQYVRHRMQNLNEVSARYTVMPNEFYIPEKWRKQDTKNRQGSTDEGNWNPELRVVESGHGFNTEAAGNATIFLKEHCQKAYQLYETMIEAGIAKEMARMVLPVNLYTEIFTVWDLKNLIHFIALREDAHAQAEIQEYGKAIKSILESIVPWTMALYERGTEERKAFKEWQQLQPKEVNA